MKPVQITLLALIVIVAALVLFVVLRNPQPPLLPADPAHAVFSGSAACLDCHGPDGDLPRSKQHPLGPECLRCHGRSP